MSYIHWILGPIKFKEYKIFQFDALSKAKQDNWEKHIREQSDNFGRINDFKQMFINKFNDESYDELVKYTLYAKYVPNVEFIKYKKDHLFSQLEIGFDMLMEKYKLFTGNYSGYGWTLAIPVIQTEMIEFLEEHAPKDLYRIKKRL